MDGLQEALAERLGGAEVTGLRRLSGGASRETWAFEAAGRPLILRRDPTAEPDAEQMAREAACLAAAAKAGVPVPELVDHGDGGPIGAPYLVMARLEGETIPRRLLRDEAYAGVRPGLAREFGRILARIHSVDPAEVPGLPSGDPVAELAEVYDGFGDPRPALELALRWLAGNRPPEVPAALVHGDFRNGNLMVGGDGVRGVLDWELAHAGDPAEDLGWLCVKAWRFGSPEPVGGFGPRAELLEGYAEAGGIPPSLDVLHWWEVYGTLRWAVLCRHQAERYLSGEDSSVELAALGRRVCEQEHDLLLALGLAEPREVTDPLDGVSFRDTGAEPHDRPGALELMTAAGGFLAGLAAPGGDPRTRFHALVAASVLRVAQRELLLGDGHRAAHRARLAGLGCASEAELAGRIRDGSLDGRRGEVVAAVRDTVADKLLVASPRHLASF